MSKFSRAAVKPTLRSGPVKTTGETTTNHAGGVAFTRDVLSELFVFAASNLVGEDTYYEGASARDQRFRELVHRASVVDPDWVARFVPYLRGEMNMRSAAVVVAVESALARLGRVPGISVDAPLGEVTPVRQLIASALQRPDEPAELIAYWAARTGSKTLPGGVQRGVGDAVLRLYNERAALKYDGVNNAWRFSDVITFAKPKVTAEWQTQLFDYLADVRWKREEVRVGGELSMIKYRQAMEATEPQHRRTHLLANPEMIGAAGYTWESLSSLGKMDKAAWEAMIPHMGIMALIRNLRNFDEAGVSDEAAQLVIQKLQDPDVIARSKQFPFRFLSAYTAAPSLRWSYPLEKALQLSARNVPELPGRTLILCDTSGSMGGHLSAKSSVTYAATAALMAGALAAKTGEVDLYGFANGVFHHGVDRNAGILKTVTSFQARIGEVGHGTEMLPALQRTLTPEHRRVIIVSDMQVFPYLRAPSWYGRGVHHTIDTLVKPDVPVFGLNVAGYAGSVVDTSQPNRFELSGFSDKVFTLFSLLSRGYGSDWPF